MRRRYLLLILLGASLLLAIMNCGVVPLLPWFTPEPTATPKVRGFTLRELFVDLSALSPDCWIYEGPKPLSYEENAGAEEALFAWFHCYHPPAPPDSGRYAIYRFRDSQAAVRGYRRAQREWFYNAFRITPYITPDWMEYQSTVAGQTRFACADFQDYTEPPYRRCVAVGQYEEYISAFSFSVSPPERMADYTGFLEQMLEAIDKRMAHYLEDAK